MADTTHPYVPRDFRAVCSQCGNIYNRSELHRKYQYIYCDDLRCSRRPHPRAGRRRVARQRPFRILPVPNAKPLNFDYPYYFVAEEAQVFDLVLQAPNTTAVSAAYAAIYLADIVNENTRPAVWLSSARVKLESLLTFLLSQQAVTTTANPRYGGYLVSGSYSSITVMLAGLAFIKGYRALGTPTYLVAAKASATFLRRAQCGNLLTVRQTVYPSGGSAFHLGGISLSLDEAAGTQSGLYSLTNVYALSFFKALAAVIGAASTFGDTISTAYFTAATSASLTTMMAELVTFAETGVPDSAAGGAYVTGLSTTAPRPTYNAYLSDATGTGTWTASASITSLVVAQAVAGLYAAVGADETVTAVLAWMAAMTANPANATPSTNTPARTIAGITGTYDPAIAPATAFTTAAPFTDVTGSEYGLDALGILAPVYAATAPAQLRASRATLSPGQPWSTFYVDLRYLGPIGRAGFNLQPVSTTSATFNVQLASAFGNVYRYLLP
jgi:hypothetical protein